MSAQQKEDSEDFKRTSFILQDPPQTSKKDPVLNRNQGTKLTLTKENKPKFTYKPTSDALSSKPGIKPYHAYMQDFPKPIGSDVTANTDNKSKNIESKDRNVI